MITLPFFSSDALRKMKIRVPDDFLFFIFLVESLRYHYRQDLKIGNDQYLDFPKAQKNPFSTRYSTSIAEHCCTKDLPSSYNLFDCNILFMDGFDFFPDLFPFPRNGRNYDAVHRW